VGKNSDTIKYWYSNAIGHPSHAQTTDIRNKHWYSKPLSVTCTIKCFKNISVGNRWQEQVREEEDGEVNLVVRAEMALRRFS